MSRTDRGAINDIRQRRAFQRQSVMPIMTACGEKALVGGTATVNAPKVTSSSLVMLTRQLTGGTAGHLSVGDVTPGTGFVINSSSGTDTSTVGWVIVEP